MLLERHRAAPFCKPYADYNVAAFAASMKRRKERAPDAPLILDAGCGVGASSIALAQAFPEHYVIGVDKSASRLSRNIAGKAEMPANVNLVRADLVNYWRLLREAQVRLARHYLLYPNPWPKIGQLSRRWHGHAVFPALIELGGRLECRSNWPIYIDEFAFAIERLTGRPVVCEAYLPVVALTPFERKYHEAGHRIHRAIVLL